ncbi:MAG TPA: GAF and ANTAR domain-containing protein, partial [Nitriliruptoraceae bacterium]|nr:GAF and ANTAR domain-containing protein [Nitriliruptoraceae bacterium]
LNSYDIGSVLFRLTDQIVTILDVDSAGVSIAEKGERLRPVAASGSAVAALHAGDAFTQGPSERAWRIGERVTVADMADDDRWPAYAQAVLDQECRAVAALPMPVDAKRIGAVEMVRRDVHEWEPLELQVAQVLADMASGYVLNSNNLEESRNTATQLQYALDSRVVVEQAKGVLAERDGITPVQAFQRLREHARANQVKVHDVCRELIDGTLDLSA